MKRKHEAQCSVKFEDTARQCHIQEWAAVVTADCCCTEDSVSHSETEEVCGRCDQALNCSVNLDVVMITRCSPARDGCKQGISSSRVVEHLFQILVSTFLMIGTTTSMLSSVPIYQPLRL